jgi:hypothetical protein
MQGTLVAIALVVGSAHIVSAASKMLYALGPEEALEDDDSEEE